MTTAYGLSVSGCAPSHSRRPKHVLRSPQRLDQECTCDSWSRSFPSIHQRALTAPASRSKAGGRSSNCYAFPQWTLIALFCIITFVQTTSATTFSGAMSLGLSTGLIFDRSEPPLPRPLLHKRDQDDGSSSTSTTTPDAGTASISSTASLPSITAVSSPLPQPFDTNLGSNFTSSTCPAFFQQFLSDPTFISCHPLSLLLKTSTGFFSASRSLPALTQVLDATCNVNFAQCSALMASLASQIQQSSACGADFALQNPMVDQAYNGFVAYQPLYHAGCMVNNSTRSYCYAEAVTNTSAPTSSYVYYLPLGMVMPAGMQPTCNRCLQSTMSVFAAAASNGSIPALTTNYLPAADQVDMFCGPTFAQTSLTMASSAVATFSLPALTIIFTLVSAITAWDLLI